MTQSEVLFSVICALCVTVTVSTPVSSTQACHENEFWDVGTYRCESCAGYCHDASARGMTEICAELCPVYHSNAQVAKIEKQNVDPNLEPKDVPKNGQSTLQETHQPATIPAVAVPIAVVLVVAVVVGSVVLYRRRIKRGSQTSYKATPTQDDHDGTGQHKLLPSGKSSSFTDVRPGKQAWTPIYKPSSLNHLPVHKV